MNNENVMGNEGAKNILQKFVLFVSGGVVYTGLSLKKNTMSALIVFLAVVSAGAYYLYTDKNKVYYQTDMACISNSLNDKIIGEMVEKLNILATTKSYMELSRTLHIDMSKASSIISIKTKNVFGKPIANDTVHRSNTLLYFIVKAKSRDVFPELQASLLNYLNGTPYQELRIQSEKERIDSKARFIYGDLAQIDSIFSAYPAFLKHITSISISDSSGSFFDVSNIISLLSYKDKTEDRLLYEAQTKNFMAAVELVHGFLCPERPENETRKSIMILISIAIGATLMWALCINMIKNGVYAEITKGH